jgi:hypothetical protein
MGDINLVRPRPWLTAIAALLLIAFGLWLGYKAFSPAVVVETPAPAVEQQDGSKVIKRAPDAKAKPKHMTPKGAKVERVVSVTLKSKAPSGFGAASHDKISGLSLADCPPVTLDLSLVREQDGGKRVVASSPDGEILKAIDIPVETAAAPEEQKKWAAGLSWSPTNETLGAWIERDVWLVRLGAEINQVRRAAYGPTDIEARVRVGVMF